MPMQELTEIRWHARAGQGAVTAAKLVAETALKADQYIQAMPEYGPERMGAPIQAFTRISSEPIDIHCNIEDPSVVVVLDESLLKFVPVAHGLTDGGVIIVNTCSDPEVVRKALHIAEGTRVACVDATGISMETLKRDMPNTPMLGALAACTDQFTADQFADHLAKTFGKKFSQDVIDANVEAVQRAAKEVTVR
jgi:pyruvate ferredoxin oxidoreductase gamma subunit